MKYNKFDKIAKGVGAFVGAMCRNITIVFIVLKLLKLIDYGWWIILFPVGIGLVFGVLTSVALGIIDNAKYKESEKNRPAEKLDNE